VNLSAEGGLIRQAVPPGACIACSDRNIIQLFSLAIYAAAGNEMLQLWHSHWALFQPFKYS
jgi:hypothetical protein